MNYVILYSIACWNKRVLMATALEGSLYAYKMFLSFQRWKIILNPVIITDFTLGNLISGNHYSLLDGQVYFFVFYGYTFSEQFSWLQCFFSEKYDELIITLHFRRRFSYYLVRIYMPLILIVCMSFGAFWIDYRSTPARTIMSTTIVLTVVTFIVSIQGSLPPTKSIRSIDIYTLCCFMFVFAALIEFAFVQTIDVQVKIIIRNHEKVRSSLKSFYSLKSYSKQILISYTVSQCSLYNLSLLKGNLIVWRIWYITLKNDSLC